jgi:multidrug efflux pump subunit AcrA (membrane-fusion protein)
MAPNAIDALEKSHKLQPAVVQITAPVDGELFDLQIRVGQRLTTNQAIISIGQIEPIVVESRVPLQAANQLSLKQKAQLVSLDLVGEIEYIPNFSDPMTQTMNVHIEFTNENHQLRPGQLVTLSFLFEAEPNTPLYVIPRGAISRYDGQDVVYLRQDTRIQVLPIEVKNITGNRLYFTTAAPLPAKAELLIESTAAVKGLLETAEGGE